MNLIRRLFAASAVSDLQHPSAWLIDAMGARKTTAGVPVTEATALTASAVFACVRALAEDEAKLPYVLYRRLDDEGKDRARDEPLYELLHDEPNPEMSAFDFRSAVTGCAVLLGNGYAEIERKPGGYPVAMWPLHPSRVSVKRDGKGTLFYVVDEQHPSKEKEIPAVDMLHIRGFGPDGIAGYMVAKLGRESIGLTLAVQRFGASFFGNGAMAGIVLTSAKALSDKARENMRKSWLAAHPGGPDKQHGVAILEEDTKLDRTTYQPDESQFLETQQFQVEDVARWFRMPPHKIQHLLRATFSNIEHQGLEYVTDTLMPWLVRWEQETKRKVIPPGLREELFAEHLVDAQLRGDTKSRAESNQIQFQNGALTLDEWRAMENRNPLADGQGKVHYVQMNLEPVGEERHGDGDDDGESAEATAEAITAPVFAEAAKRVLNKEIRAAARAAKKYVGDAEAFGAWAQEFYEGHRGYVHEALFVPCRLFADLAGIARPVALGCLDSYVEAHLRQSTADALAAFADGEMSLLGEGWGLSRVALIPEQITKDIRRAAASARQDHARA